MPQQTLTVVSEVVPDSLGTLRALLNDVRQREATLFDGCDVHFARFVLLDEQRAGTAFDSALVFESNFDVPTSHAAAGEHAQQRQHLEQLVARKGSLLHDVFAHTRGAPAHDRDDDALLAHLCANLHGHTARYQGHVDRELQRVMREREVRTAAVASWARHPELRGRALWQRIRDDVEVHLRERGLELPTEAPETPSLKNRDRLRRRNPVLSMRHALRVLRLLLAHVALRRPGRLHHFDLYDRHSDAGRSAGAASPHMLLQNLRNESDGLQNELTHVVPVLPGQEPLLRYAHAALAPLAANYYDHVEDLGGSPAIHFAKWVLMGEGKKRRLLFLSNYDFSWESYLDDFVNRTPHGLNLAWHATHDYPKTYLGTFGGASDEQRFKLWARAYQRSAQVFYRAYPDLSVMEINNNTWITAGLYDFPEDFAGWLRRLT